MFQVNHFLQTCIFGILILIATLGCNQCSNHSENGLIQVVELTDNVFVHTSNMNVPLLGPFPCNGLIFVDDGEALVFDTPVSEAASEELLEWIDNELDVAIVGVVVTHFHVDCLGGLAVFHDAGIPSFAQMATLDLAASDNQVVPQTGFEEVYEIPVGNEVAICRYFGEGHTVDNIVGYIPSREVLFGGCLVKEVGANQGNISDANLAMWGPTVAAVKAAYPNLQQVVPGHGASGGVELLDFTIELFANE